MSASDLAISIRGLSKAYRIWHDQLEHSTLAEQVLHRLRHPFSRVEYERFWALRGVDLEIERGEVVGIIGRNGAGKSTLLKVLSRITPPTEGEIDLYGRVGSLLEVGTGFHPELTGRENIFLNGSILGMKAAEIRGQFDAIVDFAGVEQFLDTPVKRYSSGMRVRLAFAVAAHLRNEILIVDEVLAVGDAEFQKRCLGKMHDVAHGEGRTVLFVSHRMEAIQNLCGRVIVLADGRTVYEGAAREAIDVHMDAMSTGLSRLNQHEYLNADGVIRRVWLKDHANRPTRLAAAGRPITVAIEYSAPNRLVSPRFGVGVDTMLGQRIAFLQTTLQHGTIAELPPEGVVECHIPCLPFAPGRYLLTIGCAEGGRQVDRVEHGLALDVEAADFYGTGRLPASDKGHMLIPAQWNLPATECQAEAATSRI